MDAHQAASSFGPADPAASGDSPWIGIHVLSEFVFCPRAGVLSFELGSEETGEERDRVPPLDYLPDFELELIEERLQQEWQSVGRLLLGGIGALLIVFIVFGFLVRGVFLLLLLAGVGWWLGQLVKHGQTIFTLVQRRNGG